MDNVDFSRIYEVNEAKVVLAHLMKKCIATAAVDLDVVRIELAVRHMDILVWLAAQQTETRLYFTGRDPQDDKVAGIGIADEIHLPQSLDYARVFNHINKKLTEKQPNLKYYGGFAFAPGHVDEDWQSFGACRMVIPRFELLQSPRYNKTILACNIVPARDSIETLLTQLETLILPGFQVEAGVRADISSIFEAPGQPVSRQDYPDHSLWVKNLERAIGQIKEKVYKKTVLARKVELEFTTPPNPVALLSFLTHLPSNRYDFLFQFKSGFSFVGSSPERLYKRNRRSLVSEAVAGTRSRGEAELDDLKLAKELMDSDKEQREHDFVIREIEEELRPLCVSMEVEQGKGLLKLKEGQHLITHLSGVLKDEVRDDQLIGIMHPTPAVGGCPLDEALQAINESEPFKRGWYAGIVGAVGYDCSDFAVGLRSGRTHHNSLSLYSGVGVVEGSVPEEEWREVEYKIVNFMDIINRKLL